MTTYYAEIKSEIAVTEGDTRQLQETVAARPGFLTIDKLPLPHRWGR